MTKRKGPHASTDPPAGEEERPTVVPEFDPAEFARDSEVRRLSHRPASEEPTIDEARRLLREGAPEEALFRLTRLLELAPLHAEGNALAVECREALGKQCLAAIGSLGVVLAVVVTPAELKTFSLDHVSGFLVSLIDGATDVETLLDLSGMPRLLALRHLRGLVARGIVAKR